MLVWGEHTPTNLPVERVVLSALSNVVRVVERDFSLRCIEKIYFASTMPTGRTSDPLAQLVRV
jgi:hypothetical protein